MEASPAVVKKSSGARRSAISSRDVRRSTIRNLVSESTVEQALCRFAVDCKVVSNILEEEALSPFSGTGGATEFEGCRRGTTAFPFVIDESSS